MDRRKTTREYFYKVIAVIALLFLFIKAAFSVDTSWDSWAYHNPFMARIWGIVTSEQYLMPKFLEERFKGFPLAIEFLQGFLWKISGHVESINLLAIFSIFAYTIFLWKNLKIPFYSSTIALLAVPLIQIHATSSYIDLFSNICLSAFLVLVYILSLKKGEINNRNLVLLLILGVVAGNSKFQLIPTLVLGYVVLFLRVLLAKEKSWFGKFSKSGLISILFIGVLLSFGTVIKNFILYSNPFYPVELSLGIFHFNGPEGQYSQVPEYLKNSPRIVQWLLSVTEIDFLIRKLWHKAPLYTLAMEVGDERRGNLEIGGRTGGYFGPYVAFQICLFAYYLIVHFRSKNKHTSSDFLKSNEETSIFVSFGLLTLFSSLLPQSLELRYYLYWIILLITINLCITANKPSFLSLRKINFISTMFLLAVILITRFSSFYPNLVSFEEFKKNSVDSKTISQIRERNQSVCLEGYLPFTFLYVAPFNNGNYALQDGWNYAQGYCSKGYSVIVKPQQT